VYQSENQLPLLHLHGQNVEHDIDKCRSWISRFWRHPWTYHWCWTIRRQYLTLHHPNVWLGKVQCHCLRTAVTPLCGSKTDEGGHDTIKSYGVPIKFTVGNVVVVAADETLEWSHKRFEWTRTNHLVHWSALMGGKVSTVTSPWAKVTHDNR
jgi:hypothetical protein